MSNQSQIIPLHQRYPLDQLFKPVNPRISPVHFTTTPPLFSPAVRAWCSSAGRFSGGYPGPRLAHGLRYAEGSLYPRTGRMRQHQIPHAARVIQGTSLGGGGYAERDWAGRQQLNR